MLEGDFIDSSKNLELAGGRRIVQGVEFDAIGRRVAYWMWTRHPGERMFSTAALASVRVPAEQVLHVYDVDRPGQVRGVTEFVATLMKMYDLDNYDEADLVRKQMEACIAMIVTQAEGVEGPTMGDVKRNPQTGAVIEEMSPGMVPYLRPGEQVQFNNPPASGNFSADLAARLRSIAAGLGVTYEQLTGDLSQVNYSSLRHGLLEFRAWVEYVRWQVLIPQLCGPVWRRFIDRAYLAGLISAVDYSVEWSCPPFQMVDPYKDGMAAELAVRTGALTWAQMVAERGYDPDDQLDEIAAYNKKMDARGVVSDADPRKTARSGAMQADKTEKPAAAKEGRTDAESESDD